jgi:hypothetical protein
MAFTPVSHTSKALVVLTVGVLTAAAIFLQPSMILQHAAVTWRGPDLAEVRDSSSHTWRLDTLLCQQHPVSLSCAPGGWTPLPSDETFLEGDAACNFTKVAFVGDRYACSMAPLVARQKAGHVALRQISSLPVTVFGRQRPCRK